LDWKGDDVVDPEEMGGAQGQGKGHTTHALNLATATRRDPSERDKRADHAGKSKSFCSSDIPG
jgi:hypothetical protein